MADEALLWTRRVSDIGLKTGLRARLKPGSVWYKGSLSVRVLPENAGNLRGTGAALTRNSCTRVKPASSALDCCYQRESAFYQPKCTVQNNTRLLENPRSRRYSYISVRTYSGNGDGPLYRSKTGYYDILGVSPSATHAQIKTAYYKQSFAFHPDRNAGSDEATLRFSEISEAYTVLGHKTLRKKYDRGLLSPADLTASARASRRDPAAATPARRPSDPRRSALDPEGRGRVFDFDTFFKAHYGEQLQRDRDIRVRKEEMEKRRGERAESQAAERMMGLGVGLLVVVALGILVGLKRA